MTTVTTLNLFEFDYYPFMVSIDKCSEYCNAPDELSTKPCVFSKTEDLSIKVFNLITRKNAVKAMINHIFC